MNLCPFLIATFAIVLSPVAFSQDLPEPGRRQGAASSTMPVVIQNYLSGAEARLAAEPEVQEAADYVNLHHEVLFAKPAVDIRNGNPGAWLVGLAIGQVDGTSMSQVARIVLLSETGEEIFKYPDPARGERVSDGGFTEAVVVTMAPDIHLIAMASPTERQSPGGVSIRTMGSAPLELLRYEDLNYPAEPGLESELYFYDVNGDGRKELLIEKVVLHYSQARKETHHLIFSLQSDNQSFAEATSTYQNQLAVAFSAAKADATTPQITQHGRLSIPMDFTEWPKETVESTDKE